MAGTRNTKDPNTHMKAPLRFGPLAPRTSEDCEYACQAYLTDRVGQFYQGSYTASSLPFFRPMTDEIEFYPTCGRYLYVNAPKFDIVKQKFIVTSRSAP